MPKFIQKYQCTFCEGLYNTYTEAENHESTCEHNPSTKKCSTCSNLVYEYGNFICAFTPADGSSTYDYYDNTLSCPYHIKDK